MKVSLGKKIATLMILIAVILTATCILVSNAVVKNMMDNEYKITADAMAATSAAMIDGDKMQIITDKVMEIYKHSELKLDNTKWKDPRFEEYSSQYLDLMEDETYLEIQERLRKIQDVGEADCVYTLCPVPDDETFVYIVDAAYDDELVTPGCFDLTEDFNRQYLNDLDKGLPAFITNTPEYGWLVTACSPVYNSSGKLVCFAAVDIDMNEIVSKENSFLMKLTVLLISLTMVISIFAIIFVRNKIVKPINMLSEAAGQYSHNSIGGLHSEFSTIKIHTGDELEILLGSMVQMEKDIDKYIDSLTRTRAQLSTARQQADDMHELAHMDSLTGIRNRLAYDKEIIALDNDIHNGLENCGIAMIDLNFLKTINDTYGHEYGNTALVLLSKLICDIFAHSPVFRIGGDEFAVILKNHDFEHIKDLVMEFERKLRQTGFESPDRSKFETISAALGYAIFDKHRDNCADDVFKRADKNMYDRKKAMKAER